MKLLASSIQWSNTVGEPWSLAQVADIGEKTRQWFLAGSYGKMVFTVDVAPWVRVSVADTGDCGSFPYSAASSLLAAAGFPQSNYAYALYITPRIAGCGFKGFSSGWLNCGGSDYVYHAAKHEWGHRLGLNHPYTLVIGSKVGSVMTVPGVDVTIGGTLQDLYDASTTMGYQTTGAQFSIPEKEILGWVTPILYNGGDHTYVMTANEVQGGSLYGVKVAMSAFKASSVRRYWFEYRKGTNVGEDGVQVRVTGDFKTGTRFAHINPAQPLQVGERFTDGTIQMDVLAMTPTEATIRLQPAAAIPPPPPPPTGNAMLKTDALAAWTALDPDHVTQAQKDALIGYGQALVVEVIGTPPPPGSSWKIASGDMTEHTDEASNRYQARDWNAGKLALKRNGTYIGFACLEAYYPGSGPSVYVMVSAGRWWVSTNNSAWGNANGVPPGYV